MTECYNCRDRQIEHAGDDHKCLYSPGNFIPMIYSYWWGDQSAWTCLTCHGETPLPAAWVDAIVACPECEDLYYVMRDDVKFTD